MLVQLQTRRVCFSIDFNSANTLLYKLVMYCGYAISVSISLQVLLVIHFNYESPPICVVL